MSGKLRPSTASTSNSQSSAGRPSSAHSRQQHASAPEPHTSELTGESGLPGELLQVEECGAPEAMKAAVVALLKRKPDNPLLFLAAHFNDKLSCRDSLARAYGHVCSAATTETEFMDNASKAYLALQRASGGDVVTGIQYARLVKELIGPGWPKTETCTFRALREPGDSLAVSFRDFHIGLRFCLLVRRLQMHARGCIGKTACEGLSPSSTPMPPSTVLTEAYMDVMERVRREASAQSKPEIVEAFSSEGASCAEDDASTQRWSIYLDTFVHDLLSAVTASCADDDPIGVSTTPTGA